MEPEPWMVFAILAVEFINLGLLLGLLNIYYTSYKETKSKFSIHLMFFASVFLLKSLLFVGLMGFFICSGYLEPGRHPGEGFWPASLNIVECVALAILYRITRE